MKLNKPVKPVMSIRNKCTSLSTVFTKSPRRPWQSAPMEKTQPTIKFSSKQSIRSRESLIMLKKSTMTPLITRATVWQKLVRWPISKRKTAKKSARRPLPTNLKTTVRARLRTPAVRKAKRRKIKMEKQKLMTKLRIKSLKSLPTAWRLTEQISQI